MRAEHYNLVANLTDEEARHVLRHHLKLITPDDEPSLPLLMRMIAQHRLDQRHVLQPMFRSNDPISVHAIETITGRPITRIKRITAHAQTQRLSRPPRPQAQDNRIISTIQPNPKKPGSASYERYSLYKDGMTVSEARALGVTNADMKWDSERGYVVIT